MFTDFKDLPIASYFCVGGQAWLKMTDRTAFKVLSGHSLYFKPCHPCRHIPENETTAEIRNKMNTRERRKTVLCYNLRDLAQDTKQYFLKKKYRYREIDICNALSPNY